MSCDPTPSSTPTSPCERCQWPVNAEILADTPGCPHGWQSFDDVPLADIKAAFVFGAPDLSIDPGLPCV